MLLNFPPEKTGNLGAINEIVNFYNKVYDIDFYYIIHIFFKTTVKTKKDLFLSFPLYRLK